MEEKSKEETVEQEKTILEQLKEKTEKAIEGMLTNGVPMDKIDVLYKLVDIHKDVANEEYWLEKKEVMSMRYKGYSGEYGEGNFGAYSEGGSYGRRGVPGSGRGRYSEGSYGRRGVKGTGRGRYRGGEEEMMEEMMYHYGNYSEGSSYGAEGEAMESLSKLMESAYEYFKELKENANSPEEIKMMEHYFKKMGQM